MKKYIKNKNFIPQKIYEKYQLKEGKNENKILIVLLILNLILLPINLNERIELKEIYAQNEKLNSYNEKGKFNIEHICGAVDKVISDNINEAQIDNDNGKIVIDKLEDLENINIDNFWKINEVKENSNKEYEVGVTIGEKNN